MRPFLAAGLSGRAILGSYRSAGSYFDCVPKGAPDSILGLSLEFQHDPHPNKVNLAVGVYRDDNNRPFVLESVKKADTSGDMEYAPINGVPSFLKVAQKLCFGDDCSAIRDGRIASCQTLGGTGALRVSGEVLHRFVDNCSTIHSPNPGYANHAGIFLGAGIKLSNYTYYNPATKALDIPGMLESLDKLPERSVVLMHACAHNPTGLDPTQEEWVKVAEVIKRRNLLPLVDMAYQGFASGDIDRDAFLPRHLVKIMPNLIVAQSFAKNFGLYGHRCGALHIIAENPAQVESILSQTALIIRSTYSNPPIFGARVVNSVLNSPELTAIWREELNMMSGRLRSVRQRLVKELKECGSTLDWSHVVRQIGMMAYTGLTKEQVELLKKKHHVYMTLNGRAAISGLNSTNVVYVAKAFHDVTNGILENDSVVDNDTAVTFIRILRFGGFLWCRMDCLRGDGVVEIGTGCCSTCSPCAGFFFFSTWGNWCLLDTVGTVFMLTRTLITIVPTYNASHVDFPEEKLRVGMTGVLSRHLFECSTEIDLVL
ncbi:Aminotransferase [Trypanosoma melophagium]|uniref:Aminotransferase n=1 Tax=Trypanosoma melophagium TaxID=715481 RepID=UPI00351A717C|nr:Aminotransferase [Trypanosoma melophagium]